MRARIYHQDGSLPSDDKSVWVYGSNERGANGRGAALVAQKRFGARRGVARGRNGRAYAIPTKDESLQVRPLRAIEQDVRAFIDYARSRPDVTFFVTAVGCGLAGYEAKHVAPMFEQAPGNCSLPDTWEPWLDGEKGAE